MITCNERIKKIENICVVLNSLSVEHEQREHDQVSVVVL